MTPALLMCMILTFMIQMGIVGLPNVGKSTLFNTLGKVSIPAENFPFCTIEPNNVSSMMHSTCTCPGLVSGLHSNHCVFVILLALYALQPDAWSEICRHEFMCQMSGSNGCAQHTSQRAKSQLS